MGGLQSYSEDTDHGTCRAEKMIGSKSWEGDGHREFALGDRDERDESNHADEKRNDFPNELA